MTIIPNNLNIRTEIKHLNKIIPNNDNVFSKLELIFNEISTKDYYKDACQNILVLSAIFNTSFNDIENTCKEYIREIGNNFKNLKAKDFLDNSIKIK